MPQRMSGGSFIAETLHGYGVTHIFYVEAILRRALVEMEALGIQRILTHSEKAAAYMADGYARASRRPSVCMAQSVGAANLASGLQDPFLGRSPVIALTGRKDFMAQYRNAYQEILHGPMFEPVTKYNVSVDTLEQLPLLLRQAFREATSGTPGPVHLDLLGHVGQGIGEAEAELEVMTEESFARVPAHRPAPEAESVREAARLLAGAKRPVIVAGGGAALSRAGSEILELAEKLSIPVAMSLNGKEVLLETHPLNLGVVGRYSRWCANRVVSEADLVLFIGTSAGEHVTHGWLIPKPGTPVIQIDIDPAALGRNYPRTLGLAGDAKVTVRALVEATAARPSSSEWAKRAQNIVADWRKEIDPLRTSHAIPIRPERLCHELTTVLPSNAILVVDTGFAAIWTGTMVYLTHPDQRYIRCAGSLGWGFPASLGAKCAAPDRPVICFTGDGGFWYHVSELETARRCGIHTVTIVNNNAALGQCLVSIEKLYRGRSGNPDPMYRFSSVNFARIAEELGCLGIRVESPQEIAPAIEKALSADRPVVVDVVTDVRCFAADPWSPQS